MPAPIQKTRSGRIAAEHKVTRHAPRATSHVQPSGAPAWQPALADLASASPPSVIALQRAAGNHSLSQLIQAKLTVGGVNDRYEQEADRVAESVVGMPAPKDRGMGTTPAVQREADGIQTAPLAASISRLVQRQGAEEEEEVQTKPLVQRAAEEEEEVQTKAIGRDGYFNAGRHVEQRLSALQGSGSPLPDSVRAHMEPRFGADFGSVRLHADSEAGQLNRDLQARAFTHGNDIYMGSGAYSPGSPAGDRLLAHELTHVIQQSGSKGRIARWGKGMGGGTPHPVVTKMAFDSMDPNVRKYFSQEARDYLAEHTDDIDKRFGYLIPVGFKILGQKITQKRGKKMYRGGLKLNEFSKMVKKAKGGEELAETYEADAKERAREYDAIEGYVRNPAEAPNHAEGGMYKSFSGEGAGKFRIDEYVNKAIQQYNSKNPREAMYTLALALHTTQDKGAHGEGAPGTGHDPRKFFPPPNHYAKTGWVYWEKGKGKYPNLEFSSCDNIDQNPRGLQIAEGATHNTLRQFVEGIGVHIGDMGEQSEDDLAKAGRLISWTRPGWLSRTKREVGRWFGGTGVIKNMRGMEQLG